MFYVGAKSEKFDIIHKDYDNRWNSEYFIHGSFPVNSLPVFLLPFILLSFFFLPVILLPSFSIRFIFLSRWFCKRASFTSTVFTPVVGSREPGKKHYSNNFVSVLSILIINIVISVLMLGGRIYFWCE